ncbi:hypothetical protein YH66_11840 [[Brevibacterium] flavum]|uniref:Uncharacterized protein n=1 Tax=[Brevibacterium] flavum TaxID=92706 RepID=A0A0F6SRL9_9CORY|nr:MULTISPECIES: hypothetical protein [Corynebacterium]AKF28189.1 hypothetical protein YH66_11840 [[Brevibacterium] flavum]ANE09024.1 hypothetical protein A3654_11910 [Corynebacterium glutamicum]AST21435.1 hypothetical protein CEY17_12010 [Corynebacterium glutamicum ATCC 14067]KEI23963.1 hypothetical protein KIQ_015805 [Corynebacterium glutamicum ATCC 14067]KIH72986.1 hypothetical protein SD36_11895 [Corynebacterium glutamicum]
MATFNSVNLTREAGEVIEPYRLVSTAAGKITHADGTELPFGAVTEGATPEADRPDGYLAHGLPHVVRVHAEQSVVKLQTEATGLVEGDLVYAAADGLVAKTGTVAVGLVDKPESGGIVRVNLFHPIALAANVAP